MRFPCAMQLVRLAVSPPSVRISACDVLVLSDSRFRIFPMINNRCMYLTMRSVSGIYQLFVPRSTYRVAQKSLRHFPMCACCKNSGFCSEALETRTFPKRNIGILFGINSMVHSIGDLFSNSRHNFFGKTMIWANFTRQGFVFVEALP
jgi:hypothetical protein